MSALRIERGDARPVDRLLAVRLELGLRYCLNCGVDTLPIQGDMCAFCDRVGLTDPKGIG